jgi:hypothetical protein
MHDGVITQVGMVILPESEWVSADVPEEPAPAASDGA